MSQIDLNGDVAIRKDHLTLKFPGENAQGNAHKIHEDKDREYYCRKCHQRVTESVDGGCEYGHAKDCEHSVWGDRQ